MAQRVLRAVVWACLAAGALAACQRQSAAQYLAEAEQLSQQGKRKAAQIQLKNALASEPDNGAARLLLARLALELEDVATAEKEARRALQLAYQPDASLALLVQALMARGAYDEVLAQTESRKDEPAVRAMRGGALLAQRKLADAKAEFEASLRGQPDNPAALSGLARHAVLSQDLEAAMRFNDAALAQEQNNTVALALRAEILRFQGKPEQARQVYQELLALQPGKPSVLVEQAMLDMAAGQLEQAQAALTAAAREGQRTVALAYTQALLHFTRHDYGKARDALDEVLKAAPRHPPSLLLAGTVQLALGGLAQAEQYLAAVVAANPHYLHARKLLAATRLRARQPEAALEALGPFLHEKEADLLTLELAGEALRQQREFSKAAGYLGLAVARAPDNYKLRIALGNVRLQMGERAVGIRELERACELAPASLEAGLQLVRARLQLREFDQALAALAPLEQRHPQQAVVLTMRGLVQLARREKTAARQAFEQALARDPASFVAVFNLARLDVQEGRSDAASARLAQFAKAQPQDAEVLQALAQLAEDRGQWQVARAWLAKAAALQPADIPLAVRAARFELAHGQPATAVAAMRKLQTANPEHPVVLEVLGQAQAASGQLAPALETYSKLASAVPRVALPHHRMALLQLQQNQDEAALRALHKAVALEPAFAPAQLTLIRLAMRRQDGAGALQIARKMQQAAPKAGAGYLAEADILLAQGKPAPAVALYEKAWLLQGDTPSLLKLVGGLRSAGRAAEADAKVARWRQQHPQDLLLRQYLAERHLVLGDYAAARSELEGLLELYPGNPPAWNNLALARHKLKDKRAYAAVEQALAMAPEEPAFLDTAGLMLVEQGELKKGIAMLQKAASLAPDAADIRYHLAQGLLKQGEKIAAKKELQLSLANGNKFAEFEDARALLKQLE